MSTTYRTILREVIVTTIAALVVVYGWRASSGFRAVSVNEIDKFYSGKPAPEQPLELGMKFSGASKTGVEFVLVASSNCTFCRQSAGFYKRLNTAAHDAGVPLTVATPDRIAARGFLSDAGLVNARQVGWRDLPFAVEATPTLIALGSDGAVRRIWVGKLSDSRENEILRIIQTPSVVSLRPPKLETGEPNLGVDDLSKLRATHSMSIVDVRDRVAFRRGHRAEAVNIPNSELLYRSPYELAKGVLYVVDCGSISDKTCQRAVNSVVDSGYQAAALEAGGMIVDSSCQSTRRAHRS